MHRSLWLLVCVSTAAGQVSEMSLDPLLSFVSCLRDDKPGFCIRERALGYFETWLTGDEEGDAADTAATGGEEDEEPGSKLNPYWKKMIDQVAERIAGFYGEEEEEAEEEGKQLSQHNQTRGKSTALDARDKKYKKDKKVKVAMTIILLIIYFIVSQLFYMFDKVARTAIFAKLVLAFKVFVLVKLIELKRYLWWVKEEKKEEVHHEVAVHDHHWDEPEHFDHHYDPHGPHHYDPPHFESHGPWGGWHARADPYRAYHPPSVTPPAR